MTAASKITDFIAYGLDASKPATPNVPTGDASYYFATDTGKLYCWTGSAWTQVGGVAGANPTATAGPAAVNGSASTFLRSDGAPAIQLGTAAQKGIVQVDGSTITALSGVISATLPAAANPTATASDVAVNGVAPTFLRSDGSPAVQKNDSTHFGLCKPDNTTITSASGVLTAISATQLGNFHPGYVSGRAYSCPLGTVSIQSSTANTLYAIPFFVGSTTTFTKIQISGSSTHTGNCDFGLYQNSGGVPGSKITDFGSVATANAIYGFTGQTINLSAGTWYWLAAGFSATGDTANWLDASGTSTLAAYLLGASDAGLAVTSLFVSGSWTFSAGALPSSFPAIARVRFCPNIMLTP